MKKRLGRETLYLMLPVLLIGGGVLLKSKNPFAAGPRRLEIVGFKPIELTPLDVSRGYYWGTVVQTQTLGDAKLPKNWVLNHNSSSPGLNFVYRRGKEWRPVPWPEGGTTYSIGIGADEYPVKVNLKHLPKDTEEIRMRGAIGTSQTFTGPLPAGWTPPKNLKIIGTQRRLELKTAPLNVAVKAAEQPLSVPQVSRETKIALVDACWFTTKMLNGDSEDFFLHLRHSEKRNWSSDGQHTIDNLHFYDGDGKEIEIYRNNGKGKRAWGGQSFQSQERFSPSKRGTDLIVSVLFSEQAPRKPWNSYKQPIRVEADISDGTCWPTKINTTMRHEEMTMANQKKFGEPVP